MKLICEKTFLPPIPLQRDNKWEKLIDHNSERIIFVIRKLYSNNLISDKLFLSLMYRCRIGRWLNWKKPRYFTEKLQILKLYNRKDEYTKMVDKVKAKEIVAEKVGEEYVVPNYAVWDSPEKIDFDALPDTFVIKCNHSTGDTYIHSSPSTPVDKEKIIRSLNSNFKKNLFKNNGEWPYKNVERKVFAEKYLDDLSKEVMPDYKILCFNGKPKFIQVFSWPDHYVHDLKRERKDYNVYYDLDWNKQEFMIGYPYDNEIDFPKPENLEKMIEIAEKLSKGIPFVKIDLYNLRGEIKVGEMTFFPYGGFGFVLPNEEWDLKLGELLQL